MYTSAKNKPKGLADSSVGQRPTLALPKPFKAVSLAYYGLGFYHAFIRKAYSLVKGYAPFRRALPYAMIRKAFSLCVSMPQFFCHYSVRVILAKEDPLLSFVRYV